MISITNSNDIGVKVLNDKSVRNYTESEVSMIMDSMRLDGPDSMRTPKCAYC